MKNHYFNLAACLVLLACSNDLDVPEVSDDGRSEHAQLLEPRSNYRIEAPALSDLELGRRARQVAEVVLARALVDSPFLDSIARQSSISTGVWIDRLDTVQPGLLVQYDRSTDSLYISNEALEFQISESRTDKAPSEADARAQFDRVIAQLDSLGLIAASDYDLKRVRLGWTDYVPSVRSDEQPEPKILNFRFNAQRILDGMPFRDSRVGIAIDKSGAVASIRLRRSAIKIVPGERVPATLSLDRCQERFAKDYPNSHVYSSELAYVLPNPQMNGAAELKCVISFSELMPQFEGEPGVARRQEARYSLSDLSAAATVLPPPVSVSTDARPREP